MLKSNHFRHGVWLLGVFVLSAAAASHSFAGQMAVANNGQPLKEATVSISTLRGEQLATAKTDGKGIVQADIPGTASDRLLWVKVTDNNGNLTHHIISQTPGEPWHLLAVDTAGGIMGYTGKTVGFLKDAARPISVGTNAEVGSGAKMTENVRKTASRAVGGVLGGMIGGGTSGDGGGLFGGSGIKSPITRGAPSGGDINTVKDPVADGVKRVFFDPRSGTKIAVGTKLTPDGLLVSTSILESPGDGTFQTIYLMDPQGRKAGPIRYDVYQMYVDWKLTVHWTKDRYVNGTHVSHQEGGWSENGRDILGTFTVPHKGKGIWNNLGFSNAVQGVRSLGTFFPVSPGLLTAQPMSLVVHITRPDEDTVTTVPFIIGINEDCPCAPQQVASIMDQLQPGLPSGDAAHAAAETCSDGDGCFDSGSRYINDCAAGRSCVPSTETGTINMKLATTPTDLPPLESSSGAGRSINELEQAYIHSRQEIPWEKMCSIPAFFGGDPASDLAGLAGPPCAADDTECLEAATEPPPGCGGGECDQAQTGSIMDQLESASQNGPGDCGLPQTRLVNIPFPPS